MSERLPARLEVSALLRRTNAGGGFASVVKKGHPEEGAILVILCENGTNYRLYERISALDNTLQWHAVSQQAYEKQAEIDEILARRTRFDDDLWIIELDIADGERLIGLPAPRG